MPARLSFVRRAIRHGRRGWFLAVAAGLSLLAGCMWIDQLRGKSEQDEESQALHQARVDCGDTSLSGFGHDDETEIFRQAQEDKSTRLSGLGKGI